MSNEFYFIIKTNVILTWAAPLYHTAVWCLWDWVWPNASTHWANEWERRPSWGPRVALCTVCVRIWEPLRYQAIGHLSMTAQLCQHSPSVFLSTSIHTIMNEIHWQKCHIFLNCSLALVFSVNILISFMRMKTIYDGGNTLSQRNALWQTKTINVHDCCFFMDAVNSVWKYKICGFVSLIQSILFSLFTPEEWKWNLTTCLIGRAHCYQRWGVTWYK